MPTAEQETLIELLSCELDFHDDNSYASHNFHSFPAKFPPQLPAKFIQSLTNPGDIVLDPMNGSGTTIVEAFLSGRQGIGLDIDPLAVKISTVKITPVDPFTVMVIGRKIVNNAKENLVTQKQNLVEKLNNKWDEKTRDFVNSWFPYDVQLELMALLAEIEIIEDIPIKNFFELTFSAIVITKSGGVSLALDLAHTRPHKPKIIIDRNGNVLQGKEFEVDKSNSMKAQTKRLRSPIIEFEKRFKNNLKGIPLSPTSDNKSYVTFGDAQNIPLANSSVDLIITSPPYASNAIDYMRAHKFSLVWLGYNITDLGELRSSYIGGESTTNSKFTELPAYTKAIVNEISNLDRIKGLVLQRYYSEMTRSLSEMFRVLKTGKSAIVVVGSSVMRGKDTDTQNCFAEIGKSIGFDISRIGVRSIDRDRRMLPIGMMVNKESQIQQRMNEEYVIGFYKP
jgi:DNA modification methylase